MPSPMTFRDLARRVTYSLEFLMMEESMECLSMIL